MSKPDFDRALAHKFFSADCFNRAWMLIDRPDRSQEEDEEMVRLSQASLWHWTEREDCTATNLSIGYWQASRIHAILGRTEAARRYARLCMDQSKDGEVAPFFRAYAYEALARAEALAGDTKRRDEYLAEARRIAESLEAEDEKKQLLDDLKTIR